MSSGLPSRFSFSFVFSLRSFLLAIGAIFLLLVAANQVRVVDGIGYREVTIVINLGSTIAPDDEFEISIVRPVEEPPNFSEKYQPIGYVRQKGGNVAIVSATLPIYTRRSLFRTQRKVGVQGIWICVNKQNGQTIEFYAKHIFDDNDLLLKGGVRQIECTL